MKTISELVENLRTSEYLNYVQPEEIKGEFFSVIMEYVRGYIDFMVYQYMLQSQKQAASIMIFAFLTPEC